MEPIGPGADRTADLKLVFKWWLTPKRSAFPSLDRYFNETITEYQKPYRHRHPVALPAGLVARSITDPPETIARLETRWWRPQVDLDLLEAALAVRLDRLENGYY